MTGGENLPVVLAGLLAMLFLSAAVSLAAADQGESERLRFVLMALSAGGIAAGALFGGSLIVRILIECLRALKIFASA